MRSAFGERFDVPAGYLDTASIGIPPSRTVDAARMVVERWACGADRPPDFDAAVATARAAWADLVGLPPSLVGAGATVSQLVSLVAASVPASSRVLVAAGDFTSVSFPFAARGLAMTEAPLASLAEAVPGHDVVAVSVVQSADGAVLDVPGVLAAAREAGARVLLDVTQGLGWLPMSVAGADWVVGTGYKWLMVPRGVAWLGVSEEALPLTGPFAANWYAGEDPWQAVYGLPLRLASDARRFDLSPAWPAHVAAAASLPWLASLDREAVRAHCVGLADSLLAGLGLAPRGSAIVSLPLPEPAVAALAAAGVRCAGRAGRTRLAFHLYNTPSDVELVLDALAGVPSA
ncbi:MAG TPA: aminotransferase class V-fold PLP-dependent enzyme [Pseudonocardiaceae bacterium]